MPAFNSEWLFPAFVVLWLTACAVVSLYGGWHELAERFKSEEPVEGEPFSFRSAAVGWAALPVTYRGCLFSTVGASGFSLSILIIFRFLHPRLVIPWSAVERCEQVNYWLGKRVAVQVSGFNRRLWFAGTLGRRIFEAWTQSRASITHA